MSSSGNLNQIISQWIRDVMDQIMEGPIVSYVRLRSHLDGSEVVSE